MKKHKLIIKCLNDAQAKCNCGHWWYSFTGERTEREIQEEFKKHLKYCKKYNIRINNA